MLWWSFWFKFFCTIYIFWFSTSFTTFAFTPSYIGSSLGGEVLWFDDGLGIATSWISSSQVHADAFSNFPNPLVCLEVEDFDVHDAINVYRDLSPNFIAINYSVAIPVIDDQFIPLNEVFPKS